MAVVVNRNWKAAYYDGRTARRHDVTVLLNSSGVYITLAEGPSLWWLFEKVRIAQGYHPGEPVRLETTSEIAEAVVVDEPGFLEAFLALAPARSNRASFATERMNRSAPLLLGGMALAALVIFALWRWGIPAFADAVARRVPARWEAGLGKSVMEQLAPADQRCENPEALAKIQQIVRQMRGGAAADQPVSLAVADIPMANAFAAPGGYVVVFRGLLEQTEKAEDLAGVLAHEIQHVEQRHATRGIVRQLSLASLLALLAGDSSGMGSVIDAAGMMGAMKYQREDEESADTEGVRMLQRAGIDSGGLWRMLDRMSGGRDEAGGALEYLSSHPLTTDRVRRLQTLAGHGGGRAAPLLDGYDWRGVRYMCGEPEQASPESEPAAQ